MIKATENIAVGDLISRRVPFVVPKYQRNYAWEVDEVDDFIKDLVHLYEARTATTPRPQKHFFGGVVSIDLVQPNSMSGRVFELVDGQQRMATFLITICLLVRALKKVSDDAGSADVATRDKAASQATLTENDYLRYSEVVGNQLQQRYRVTLSKADAAFSRPC